ncbi:hypothetical protein TPL01_05630 [Sulfuriferula plumbiphila]|uniref:Uncharacterized protein n=1 Tax=Sulfuriferula plumbiphila TaxID=171865 RepID=A0A512L4M0_9PROT|nr:hypothetical protein [Sulfuriferula plumbiphila]BBP03746.1 hypothetical protein SFPGR_11680 [Sulfuriferula plumbiphila]GEP29425.1 hypothetical protein TPL01_05630 [Sulfuriferula plumbiphila]
MCRIEESSTVQSKEEESPSYITGVGIDLVKNVFSVHSVDAHGKLALKKTLSRGKRSNALPKSGTNDFSPRHKGSERGILRIQ